MESKLTRRSVLGAFSALSALTIVGCSSGGAAQPTSSAGLTKVVLMAVPTTSQAPAYLGVQQGIFEAEGLDVEFQSAVDANALTAAVTSGQATFGAGGMAAQILAIGQGVPLRVVAAQSAEARPDSATELVADGMIFVRPDNSITDVSQLAGKSIAVNGLVSNSSMVLQASLALQGVDPSSVQMVQVAFPEQNAALEGGQVDAIISGEPFTTSAVDAGMIPLTNTYPYDENGPDLHIIASWFASEQTVTSNPDLIARFRTALANAQQYAADNPEELRTAITEYTTIPEAQAARIVLPAYPTETDPEVVNAAIGLVREYLDMTAEITAEDVLAPQS